MELLEYEGSDNQCCRIGNFNCGGPIDDLSNAGNRERQHAPHSQQRSIHAYSRTASRGTTSSADHRSGKLDRLRTGSDRGSKFHRNSAVRLHDDESDHYLFADSELCDTESNFAYRSRDSPQHVLPGSRTERAGNPRKYRWRIWAITDVSGLRGSCIVLSAPPEMGSRLRSTRDDRARQRPRRSPAEGAKRGNPSGPCNCDRNGIGQRNYRDCTTD